MPRKYRPAPCSAEELREIYTYEPDTGIFRWKNPPRNAAAKPGDMAGFKTNHGYIKLRACGETHMAHRLAWLYMKGKWPLEVDHRNGIRDDNRFANLRHIKGGASIQQQNQKKRVDNSTGYTGVYFHKQGGKFRASIRVKGKKLMVGEFRTAEEASLAYLAAKRKFHRVQRVPREITI